MTTLLPKNLKQSYWIVLLLALFTTSSFATGIPTGNGADLAGCTGAPSYPTNGINIGGTQPWWEWISDVEINGVTSHSAKEGYKFFDQVGPISLTGGTQANIKLNPGLSYAQYQTNLFWNVFIDYNRDGDFDDAGENIISQSGNQLAIDEMITVPAGITPGCTRLRVTMQRDGYSWPIERFDFGEIEDYLVTLVAGNGGGGTGILTVNNVPDLTITIPQGQTSTPVFCAPPTGSTTCPAGGFSVVQTSGPASGAVLSAGVYTVVFTATDNCGNSETRTATITVLAPSNNNGILTLNPAQNQTAQIPQGQTSTPVVFNAPTGSTTCPTGGLSIVQTAGPASGSALTAGTYTVVYTATDNCGNTQTTSATITVIPAGNTGGGTPVYTTPVGGTQPWFEWIAQVDFASISNPSSKEGYKFFDQVAPAAVNTGSNQTLTITPGLSYPQYVTDLYYTAYIDYNRDGDFNDPGEEVLRQNVTSAGVTGSVQIPANASLGTTRLRIILKRDAYATSAEERFDFGETEDYLITIAAGQNNNGVLTLNPAQNQTAQIPQGQTSTPVVFNAPTATTTCPTGGLTVTQTDGPASGSALTAGTYTVVFTASDNCGNSETTSAVITVSPANNGIITLNAPASQTVTIPTGQNTTSVVFPAATGSTTCPTGGLVVTQISGPNSGQLLTAGTYTAVFNATDNCGNSQTASTVFTVVAPNNGTIALQPGTNVTVTAAQGAINAVANFPTPTATTTCPTGGLVVSQTSGLPSGSSFPIGTTTVGFVATDNCGNSETTSLVVTVNPGNGGNTPVYNTPVGGTQPWFEWISQVDFASISNPSSKEGYKFFDQVAPATVNTGSTQTLTVTPGLSWPQYVTDLYYTAYIDYNRDGDFNDPGEEILRQNVTSAGVTETVQIPANATPGTTRLRVILKRGSYATSAEERFDFGETEDYLVTIVGGNNNGILTVAPAPNQTVNITSGQTTAVVNYPAPTASTTCPLGGLNSVLTSGPASGTALTAGTYNVEYTTTDACGNSEVTTTVFTVNPPANNGILTLNGPADQTVTIAQGQMVIQVMFPDAIGSTTCPQGGLAVSQTGGPQSGANLAAGTYNVVFIASDACGNTATSTTQITVLAPAPAQLTLIGPADQNVMIAPGDTSVVVMFPDAIGTTTCAQGGLNVTQVSGPTSGSALTAGVYTVVYEATDACGNLETSTTTITVAAPNNGALTVVAPADQTVQIAPGEMTAPVLFDDPIASTTCPLGGLMVTQTAGPASGTALSAGVYTVEYTITDACGNEEITTTILTVNAPMNGMLSVNGPVNQNVQIAPGDTTAIVNFPDAVAATSCPLGGLTITQTAGPVSGTALAAGVYTVEFTITDACGNEEITTTTITVVAPMNGMITVVAPADQNVDIAPGEMTAPVVFDDPVATTTCPIGGLMVTQTAGPASGTALAAGVYTVEYSITDACGNMEMTTTIITVNAPNNGMIDAVAPADQVVEIERGKRDIVVMFDEPVATTTCPLGGLMINQTAGPASGTALVAGVYTIEYTITDDCGNMEVTTTIITVNAPVCVLGDSDGDGVCDEDDCQPHNAAIPAAPGTPCNDGMANTTNDVIASDGCSCAGQIDVPICNYVVYNEHDWEAGYGFWNDGGSDCERTTTGGFNGTRGVRLKDNRGAISSTFTDLINLSGITKVQFDFKVRFDDMENGEDLLLEYSTNGGSNYQVAHQWISGQNLFNSHEFTNVVVEIAQNFSAQTRFRFRCDASSSFDRVYLDDIKISNCNPYTDPFAGQRPTYRTLDGKLNNFVNPDYGTAGVPFAREIPAQYGDGVGSLAGPDRPSTRHISNLLSDEPQDRRDERLLSGMAYQFGQFLDHDVVLSLGGGEFSPIQVPSYDPIFAGNGIIPFTRSQAIPGVSPREQMNELTAYIDASHVYGTDPIRAEWLRSKVDGKLKVSSGNLLPYNTIDGEFDSPHDPTAPRMERDQERNGTFRILAVAGDLRANEHPNLTSLHLVFVREHNRLCDMLKAQGETDDEIIYQKARKLVGAMMQRIVYEEFLPSFGVSISPYTGYKPNVRPDVLNTWATAAFRWHTMVENDIILRNDACEGIGAVELPLKTIFSNPLILRQYGAGVLLRGLVFHPQYRTDLKVNNGLRNFLAGQGQGLDIVSINLQRGRDHGLPDYNTVRQYYGQSPASSFGDINSDYEISSRLQKAYGDINDIDLWAGIFAEPLVNGTSLPRTALAIVKKQFEVMRDGDFYFYKNDPFLTSEDNSIIEGSSLADIIMRNTSSRHIPSNIFFKPACDNQDPLEDLRDKEGKPVCTEYGAELLTSCSATSGSLKNVGSYFNHSNVRKIKVTLGYAVRIFNNQGESLYYTDDTDCLPADFSAGSITSIQVICLSDDPSTVDCTGFAGALFTTCWSSPLPIFTTGKYTMEQMKSVGLSNDDLEGLRVNNGMQVILYEHDNFEGASWTYTGPTVVCLPSHQSNKVSSFEAICLSEPNRSNCGFNGVAGAIFPYSSGDSENPGPKDHIGTSLGEGDYNRARLNQMHVDDNDIKKISVNNGYAITLFEHDNFQGNYTVYTGDESDLTTTITETRYHIWDILGLYPYTNTVSMDNMTSSIKVRCIEGLSNAPRALSTIDFDAEKDGTRAKLSINHTFTKEATTLVIEKYNGQLGEFEYLQALTVEDAVGSHVYHDKHPRAGDNLYRVLVEYTDGTTEQTDTKIVNFDAPPVLLFATQDLDGVELEWVTTILEGDEEFILERRTAVSDWTVIDQVVAPQPSETALTSRYLDEQPEVGVNEYRVRLVSSLEGRNSNEQEVDYLNTEAIVLFPNPATSDVNISLKGFAGYAVDITVANPLGQVVKTMHIDEATELPVNMITTDLIEGVHMVNVKAGGAAKTIPLVIIKD